MLRRRRPLRRRNKLAVRRRNASFGPALNNTNRVDKIAICNSERIKNKRDKITIIIIIIK